MALALLSLPSSPWLVHYTGQTVDTSSGGVAAYTSGDIASGRSGGYLQKRAFFTPHQDWATTVAAATAATQDVYFYQEKNSGGSEILSLRWVHTGGFFVVAINGVDQQAIYGQAGNVLSWGTTGSQTDPVQFDLWWNPLTGDAGFYFTPNRVQNYGHDSAINYFEARPGTPTIRGKAPTTISIGDVYCDDTGCTGLRCLYTSGGAIASAGDVTAPPILYDGVYTRSNSQSQGDTGTDVDGRTYQSIDGDIPIGSGLATPTTIYLGGTSGYAFPATWTEFGYMVPGQQYEGDSPVVGFIGDSQITSWVNFAPVPSRCRTAAEAATNKTFGMSAFPGNVVGFGAPGFWYQFVNSKLGLLLKAGLLKAVVIQGGTNDLLHGSSGSTIVGYLQTLVTSIRALSSTVIIILLPPPQEKGSLTGPEYTAWQAVSKGCGAECVGNAKVSITNVANTTPIQVTVSSPASFTSGNYFTPTGTGIAALDNRVFVYTLSGSVLTLTGTAASGTSSTGSALDMGSNGIHDSAGLLYAVGEIYNNNDGSHAGTADNQWAPAGAGDGEHHNNVGNSSYGDPSPTTGSTVRTILTKLGLQLGG